MNDVELFASLRPEDDLWDPRHRTALRSTLFAEVGPTSTAEPQAERAPEDLAAVQDVRPRPRKRWLAGIGFAASFIVVVSGLVLISGRSTGNHVGDTPTISSGDDQPTTATSALTETPATTSPSENTPQPTMPDGSPFPTVAPDAPAQSGPIDPGMTESGDSVVTSIGERDIDDALPPGMIVAPELPVVGETFGLGEPVRSDPVQRWLMPNVTSPRPVWFIRRDAAGAPIAGFIVDTFPASEWRKSFSAGELAPLDGVDARRIGQLIGWQVADGVRTVRGIDVDLTDVIALANSVVSAGDGPPPTPVGFEQIFAGVAADEVSYADHDVSISYFDDYPQSDVHDLAYMTPAAGAPVHPGPVDGSYSVEYAGLSVTYFRLPSGPIVALMAPAGADIGALVRSIHLQATSTIAVRQFGPSAPPDDAVHAYGTISSGRWAVATYADESGRLCRSVQTSFAGAPSGCFPWSTCPSIDVGGSIDSSVLHFLVVVPGDRSLEVAFGGEPAEVTIEHSNGFTFGHGTLPLDATVSPIDVTSDGDDLCPAP
jgi:hypothetical protein